MFYKKCFNVSCNMKIINQMAIIRSRISIISIAAIVISGFCKCGRDSGTPPNADFIVSSSYTDTLTVLEFDASISSDKQDQSLALSYRWDFDNDGTWETFFSRHPRSSYRYLKNGIYRPVLEAMDQDGMIDTCSKMIRITDVRKDSSMTDPRDGKIYKVVLIGDVWWMAQNLNYGTIIKSVIYPSNNGVAEKYLYNDSDSIGAIDGGLYTWQEAMDYQINAGAQGICPPGWFIPAGKQVAALWDLLLFPQVDQRAYFCKGGLLGIDLEKSGTFNIYGTREFDSIKGAFWMSEHLESKNIKVPYHYVFNDIFYINNPGQNPPAQFSALSIRCVKQVKLSE